MSSSFATIPKTAPFAEEEIDLLNRVVGPANALQRAWLAGFLAGEQAGIELFRTEGDFPANFAAATAVATVTSPYFSGADVGKIFGQAADRTPATILGPASGAIGADLDTDLTRVEADRLGAASAWRTAVQQAKAAAATAAPAQP